MGQLGLAEDPLLGSGEGAALVTKQLGLHQAFGNRGAVDLYKRPTSPLAVVVDGAGRQLFAGARLAAHQHRRCSGRTARNDLVSALHSRRAADDAVIALGRLPGQPLRQGRLGQYRRHLAGQVTQERAVFIIKDAAQLVQDLDHANHDARHPGPRRRQQRHRQHRHRLIASLLVDGGGKARVVIGMRNIYRTAGLRDIASNALTHGQANLGQLGQVGGA